MISILIKLALTQITEAAGRDPALSEPRTDMYVCICHAVTDREIRAAVARGATRLEDLTMTLGVGAGCGCCRAPAGALIEARLLQIEEPETSSIAA
jgi:bacterioferritin-associated ferredoxin